MKRINSIAAVVLLGIFALGLAGLTLTDASTADSAGEDHLIGVLITREHLDLFDFEGYMNDNVDKIFGGGVIDGDQSAYEGRLYATLVEESYTDEKGRTTTTPNYKFDTVEGISYFAAKISENGEIYTATGGDEGISDGHANIDVTDEGESISLEGTVYVAATSGVITWYCNPVYQSPDGSVYAMTGNGMSADYGYSEGTTSSQTVDATYTVTENGETKTNSTSVKVSVSSLYPPKHIRIIQLDVNSSNIDSADHEPGDLPKTLTPSLETDYIIVETYKTDTNGNEKITRDLYGRDEETLSTFVCRDDGVCIKQFTELKWAETASTEPSDGNADA